MTQMCQNVKFVETLDSIVLNFTEAPFSSRHGYFPKLRTLASYNPDHTVLVTSIVLLYSLPIIQITVYSWRGLYVTAFSWQVLYSSLPIIRIILSSPSFLSYGARMGYPLNTHRSSFISSYPSQALLKSWPTTLILNLPSLRPEVRGISEWCHDSSCSKT